MAGAQASLTIDTDAVRRGMSALLGRTMNLQEPFEQIGSSLQASTQQRFETEETPDGERWKALSPAYAMAGQSKGRDAQGRFRAKGGGVRGTDHILRDKGHLVGSITYLASRFDLAVGSNKTQAAIHHLGGTDDMAPGPAAIPARPYLGISAADEREIGDTFVEHLAGALP